MAEASSNSYSPWFKLVPNALEDQDDLYIDCDRMSGETNGDHASSGFTAECS